MTTEEKETGSGSPFASLILQKYILLTTFRKSGVAVPTVIWFAVDQDNKALYVMTPETAGKIKRIRHTERVLLAPCDSRGKPLGQEIEGNARILAPTDYAPADALLARKYGFLYRIFTLLQKLVRRSSTYIVITPS